MGQRGGIKVRILDLSATNFQFSGPIISSRIGRDRDRDRGGSIVRVRGEDDVQHAFNVAVM